MRDLLANVIHDLRTPLTSISGFAGALVDGTLSGPEGAREAGRVIGEEAERMRRLVEDLLYLGRIESGELPLDREPDRKSTRLNSSHVRISYAVFCLKKTIVIRREIHRSPPNRQDHSRNAKLTLHIWVIFESPKRPQRSKSKSYLSCVPSYRVPALL